MHALQIALTFDHWWGCTCSWSFWIKSHSTYFLIFPGSIQLSFVPSILPFPLIFTKPCDTETKLQCCAKLSCEPGKNEVIFWNKLGFPHTDQIFFKTNENKRKQVRVSSKQIKINSKRTKTKNQNLIFPKISWHQSIKNAWEQWTYLRTASNRVPVRKFAHACGRIDGIWKICVDIWIYINMSTCFI